MLILASQRIESVIFNLFNLWSDTQSEYQQSDPRRGAPPSLVEWMILAWVSGM